jgi:hypothetical protein
MDNRHSPGPLQPQRSGIRHQFLVYFISRLGPTSAPKMLPLASAATPSAALEPVAFSAGSGMKAATEPSLALPTRMPRFQPSWFLETDSDSKSAT